MSSEQDRRGDTDWREGMIWVAYNYCGDLVASAYDEDALLEALDARGYEECEVLIGLAEGT